VDPQWFVLDVNPYPWKVPPISVGRKGGKVFPTVGRDEGLFVYKESIKSALSREETHLIEGPVALYMWFWRNMPKVSGRTRRHTADTTNIQKSTEDALQGILFGNDAEVASVHSVRVAEGPDVPPMVVLCVSPFTMQMLQTSVDFPDAVRWHISELHNRKPESNNEWPVSTGEVPF